MNDLWRSAIGWMLAEHRDLHRLLSEALVSADAVSAHFGMVVILALGLGMLHALTPGHGKVILFSYFLGRNAAPWAGVAAAAQLSIVHVSVAVLLVTVVGGAVQAFGRPTGAAQAMQALSAAFVVLSGAWLLWKAFRGAPGHASHKHRSALPVALGLLPCPLTMLLMTYAVTHATYWLGLATVAIMALGIMTTISLIGTAAILIRRQFAQSTATGHPTLLSTLAWVECGSALAIILLGLTYIPPF